MKRADTPLARVMKKKYGVETVLFTYGKSRLPDPKKVDFDAAEFAEIVDIEPLLPPRSETELPGAGELARQANELERRLGVNLVDAIRTDRHLGNRFVTGAKYHHSRYGASANFAQSLDIGLRLCREYEQLIRKYEPFVVVARPGSIGTACLVAVGRGMGVPMRSLNTPRIQNLFNWTDDEHARPMGLGDAYKAAFASLEAQAEGDQTSAEGGDESASLEKSPRAQYIFARVRTRASLRHLGHLVWWAIRSEIGNRLYRRNQVYGSYLLQDLLAQTTERWFWTRRILREKPVMDGVPADLPFVFFPLHREPEATLMAEAQMADNGLIAIDWLAKTAPPGWHVVVKEHPGATSPRPTGYWERIRAYPNVIVAAMTLENVFSRIRVEVFLYPIRQIEDGAKDGDGIQAVFKLPLVFLIKCHRAKYFSLTDNAKPPLPGGGA